MAALKTDYQDDIFSGNRKYTMIQNQDGSVSFTDVTQYTQRGDSYGAAQINQQNTAVNQKGIVVSHASIPVGNRFDGNLYFFY